MNEIEELQRRIDLKKQLIELTREEIINLLHRKSILEFEAVHGKEETES